jgi:hypothetical protein
VNRFFISFGAAFGALGLFICRPLIAGATFTTVAQSGQPAPGLGAGVTYSSFSTECGINNAGQVVFAATITGPGISSSNNMAYYGGSLASPSPILQSGAPAPLEPAGSTVGIDSVDPQIAINQSGQILMDSIVTQGNTTTYTQYINTNGTYAIGIQQGMAIPGTSGETMPTNIYPDGFNSQGQVYDLGLAQPELAYPDDALLMGVPGNIQLVGQDGMQVPGQATGVVFQSIRAYPSFGGGGVGFAALLENNGVSDASPSMFVATANGVTLLSRNDDPQLLLPYVNSSGTVAFIAPFNGNEALYLGPAASPTVLYQAGNQVPGQPAGVEFSDIRSDALLTDSGKIWFDSTLTGTSNPAAAFFAGDPNNPTMYAQYGGQAPGTPAGVTFQNIEGPSEGGYGQLAINDNGQVAFAGDLQGPGVTSSNDTGIWAMTPDGSVDLVARTGQVVTIGSQNLTIESVRMLGDGDLEGLGTDYNTADQIALYMEFTNGVSGIYVAQVPEPIGFSAMMLAAGVMLLFRRRPKACIVAN